MIAVRRLPCIFAQQKRQWKIHTHAHIYTHIYRSISITLHYWYASFIILIKKKKRICTFQEGYSTTFCTALLAVTSFHPKNTVLINSRQFILIFILVLCLYDPHNRTKAVYVYSVCVYIGIVLFDWCNITKYQVNNFFQKKKKNKVNNFLDIISELKWYFKLIMCHDIIEKK